MSQSMSQKASLSITSPPFTLAMPVSWVMAPIVLAMSKPAGLTRVPVFKTIYSPVRQLIAAFSPDNESGFKRVVLIEDERRGFQLGFLTREFSVDRGTGPEAMMAVYVPTNHLYLGDIVVCPRDRVTFPDIKVEDGIRIFLTGGMALPPRVRV